MHRTVRTQSLFWFLALLLLISCTRKPQKTIITGEAQGTYYQVTYIDGSNRNFSKEIDSLLRTFDHSVSLWDDSSIISRINRNEKGVKLDSIFRVIFTKSMEVAKRTEGAFNPCVGPLVKAWGFHRKQGKLPDSVLIAELLKHIDYRKIWLQGDSIVKSDTNIELDFNAIAQGYSADLVASFLRKKGISSYLVDIGGEVVAGDMKPDGSLWRVGIEKPSDSASSEREIETVVEIANKAIATSGTYRKYRLENGRRYSHTIDPQTGFPVNHSLLSVSVVANDGITADAYATAFMVMGAEKAWRFIRDNKDLGLEAYFILDDNKSNFRIIQTPGFVDMLSKTQEK
ncbi:MAG TPA: FAD:protein FMN transferase [Bacteroidales bacterium]|nr:FAD:protein FMN transferase [Bacteroidales bacterium]